MDGAAVVHDDSLDPPPRIFERLRQIAGYTWDESQLPLHTSYESWHCFGTRTNFPLSPPSNSSHHASSPGSATRLQSGGPSPGDPTSGAGGVEGIDSAPPTVSFQNGLAVPTTENAYVEEHVVARLSYHALREERAFQIAKSLRTTSDQYGDHITMPIELVRLNPVPGDKGLIIVAIYKHAGKSLLFDVMDMGPAFYRAVRVGDQLKADMNKSFKPGPPISLQDFLDFAIGAAQCLEIIHHDKGMIHGEIRGDAFHFNAEENKVRVVSFGTGTRSFEFGLTSIGWSTLSKSLGAKNKLMYISPEQTGRMPAEPDSRTDIYSLGVLFWMLLTQQDPYDGDTPMDIIQGVLGRRIPNVSTVRIDIPEAIGRIIQKCTAKNVSDRYHSASGLRHDLLQVQDYLGEGDWEALKAWTVASKDVSSFFMLPTKMIGRERERSDLIKVIDRVAKSHAAQQKGPTARFSDGSGLSNEGGTMDDLSSDGASSEGASRLSGSFNNSVPYDSKLQRSSSIHPSILSDTPTASAETTSSANSAGVARAPRMLGRHQSLSIESRSLMDGSGSGYALSSEGNRHTMFETTAPSLSRQLGNAKFRRKGYCEVITIEGAGGMGKSCLVQAVLVDARRRGYCATAKFDTARRTAFAPLLKLLSSLFKQVWGEPNTETPFHQGLKQYVRPVWPMLHRTLGLPEFLLGPPEANLNWTVPSSQNSVARGSTGRAGAARRGSSPSSSPSPMIRNPSIASQTSQDYLRAGASTKTMRLMNTFLDVLRVFTQHKFICFCLEDLHFADDESLELISQIISSRMNMVVVMTFRPEDLTSVRLQSVLYTGDSDAYPKQRGPHVTKLTLSPLTEDDIAEFVSTTLTRSKEDILPLALVLQSKTAGNPFYMREMLSACHRKKCIWYDYRNSQWCYDLDRLFEQFRGEKDYDVLDTGFITQRLAELPPTARALLAWASLLGNSFSFEFVSRLMAGEFEYSEADGSKCCEGIPENGYSEREAIEGLQAALQAYIVVPTENEDRFRFAHDRYIHASSALRECNSRRMHFIIAQTLLKYYVVDAKQRDSTASHISAALEIIKQREPIRRDYRKLLMECAQAAIENGARPTAAKYYKTAIELLQDQPWQDGAEDGSYDETMQLYLRSAECRLFLGQHAPARELLSTIFENAKTAIDKAPAYVLQSRIFSQNGNSTSALVSLKECLAALGVTLDENPTWEKCDDKFQILSGQIRSLDRSVLGMQTPSDSTTASIGAVLSETISAAWWGDCLRFYHLTLVMLEMHLSRGAFPQSGLAFLTLAMIALGRFNMAEFAVELGQTSLNMLCQAQDPFSMARGYTLYAIFVGHAHQPLSESLGQMGDAVEFAAIAGDRMSTILSYGYFAMTKFWASENCTDLESFCQYGCEDIPNWQYDPRGGAIVLVVRQLSRALQGKTKNQVPLEIMSDEQHDELSYKRWLSNCVQHTNRSVLIYETLEIIPLFLYGHYERAVEIGKSCTEKIPMLWSARNGRVVMLFYGLALTGTLLRRIQDPRRQEEDFSSRRQQVLDELRGLIKKLTAWTAVSNVNYLSWSQLLEAQAHELAGDHGECIQHYESALDHAAEHDFVFEEALGNYLMAGFFLRRQARRSARAALLDAVSLFRQMAAVGVATAIEEEHSLLLHGPTRNPRTTDVGVQTDFVADSAPVQYRAGDGGEAAELDQVPSNTMNELKDERIGAWRGSMNMQPEAGAGLPALDMIDLHAILVSSQVISSVLQVDELLKTMCDVILRTCGGTASSAAIVVQENDAESWCVAASGDPERGASAHNPPLALSDTSLIAENVVLYSTRFLESVFVTNILGDERFGNVSDAWLQRNPLGKAIIAIPICHGTKPLLGVLYLEGGPGSFTDRNVTVLQLLVNQIGISYSNALSMKNVEKISAENRSMVMVQKRALTKALEAETKAKNAEAEANRNVKLAEEAAKAKAIFLANVSHELRTPLNGVIGNSELLRDSTLNREQLEMADSIRVSADLLLTVINDILDFSKMEADKMKLYIIAFNPEEMVREVVRAVSYSNREKTSKKNVKIVQDINLPTMLIYGDPIRLHQVLGNLIGNSLKFTEDGSITIGARLDKDTEESATLTFWVRDTGIGIPPQQLAKLFQPFSQADASTARKYGGSGLGLSICKSLIEIMMHGTIQLESEEREGTTAWFTVTFDKTKPDVSAGDALASAHTPSDRYPTVTSPTTEVDPSFNSFVDLSNIAKESVRICVAEDNPINQKIAIQYVQRLGYTGVSAYDNGLKAVEGLRQKARDGNPYHIVLMDVQMPVLDGYEATKLIRKDPLEAVRKTLVIAMTASAIQGDREKCLAAGMNDYLAKPVRSEVLKKKLDAYLSSASPQHPIASDESSSAAPEEPPSAANGSATLPKDAVPLATYSDNISLGEPLQEEAVYNQPLDSIALRAQDSPIEEASVLASRDGSGNATPNADGCSAETADAAANTQPAKRQLRKLTKNRGNSDVTAPAPVNDRIVPERASSERSRSVLTKKGPFRQSSTNILLDGYSSGTPTQNSHSQEE